MTTEEICNEILKHDYNGCKVIFEFCDELLSETEADLNANLNDEPVVDIKQEPHLCNKCLKDFETCNTPIKDIMFGVDAEPSARGSNADKVMRCDWFEKK